MDVGAVPGYRRLRVLLADDMSLMTSMMRSILRNLGVSDIHEEFNGLAIVDRYRSVKPHIVMLDINMPPVNGIDVLREIRALDNAAFVVMVSAESGIKIVRSATEAGANGFVIKPYSALYVKHILDKFLLERKM